MSGLSTRVVHLWQKRDTPEAKKLFRYTMVSVVSTVVSFAVLGLVFGVLHLAGAIVSTAIANVAAVVPNYYLNRKWVWGKGGRSHLTKEIIPFWVMSALGILFSLGGAAVARHLAIEHHLSHPEQTALVLAANILSFAIFWFLKYLAFNRLFRVHPLEELDDLVEAA
jgi:putative flippase GtrA